MLNSAGITRRAACLWTAGLEFFYPRTCIDCGRPLGRRDGGFLCPRCRVGLAWVREPCCQICGVPFPGKVSLPRTCPACRERQPDFDQARSLFLYREAGARLVHVLKYEQGLFLRDEVTLLLQQDPAWAGFFAGAALVPVPLHPRKRRIRGYNQAEVIARGIQGAFPNSAVRPCLQRVRMTPSQTFLTRQQRLDNMLDAFACRGPVATLGRLILVDDVLTTGATLNAAALALKRAGAGPVHAFTLAHG